MFSHLCNATNIFIRWNMKCSIQLGFTSLNETLYLSPQENIYTIAFTTFIICITYFFIKVLQMKCILPQFAPCGFDASSFLTQYQRYLHNHALSYVALTCPRQWRFQFYQHQRCVEKSKTNALIAMSNCILSHTDVKKTLYIVNTIQFITQSFLV